MGHCAAKCQGDVGVADIIPDPITDEMARRMLSDEIVTLNRWPPEKPLWKMDADTLKEANEAAAKAMDEFDAAQTLKKAKEEKVAQQAPDKKKAAEAREKKPNRKAASKRKSMMKAEEEEPPPPPPPLPPAPPPLPPPAEAPAYGKLDRQKIKEREQAFKARPQKEQDDLGKQIRTAAKEGNLMEVKNLLESGVAPNPPDKDGWIALMEAAQAGHAEVCKLLLDYGADPKATIKLGEWGMTALHYAARTGHLEVAKVLAPVSKLTEKNFQSKTAQEVAKAAGYKDIAKVCKPKS